jgi:hypothetical protein
VGKGIGRFNRLIEVEGDGVRYRGWNTRTTSTTTTAMFITVPKACLSVSQCVELQRLTTAQPCGTCRRTGDVVDFAGFGDVLNNLDSSPHSNAGSCSSPQNYGQPPFPTCQPGPVLCSPTATALSAIDLQGLPLDEVLGPTEAPIHFGSVGKADSQDRESCL